MYVKKLLKKLTVDYIRHTKSKTGYVRKNNVFVFAIPFYVKCSGNSGYNQPYKSLTFSKKLFCNIIKFNNKDFLFIPRNRFTIFYINIILYDIF